MSKEKSFEILLGSDIKIYLLRYFFFHFPQRISFKDIEKFFNLKKGTKKYKDFKHTLKELEQIGLLKETKNFYLVQENFFLFPELRMLSLKFSPELFEATKKEFLKLKNLLLLSLGGVFRLDIERDLIVEFNTPGEERVDIIAVFKKTDLKHRKQFERRVKKLEKAVGTEINYIILAKKEFDYRKSMFDKFLENWFANNPINLIEKIKV